MAKTPYYFELPAPIALMNIETDAPMQITTPAGKTESIEPVSFLTFVRRGLMHDKRWLADADSVQTAADFIRAIRVAMKGDGIVELDAEDFEKRILVVARSPENGYGMFANAPEMLVQVLPHIRALTSASTTKPSAKTKPDTNGAQVPAQAQT